MDSHRQLIHLLDFTRLVELDTEADVAHFCERANTPLGPVAAICVYPAYIALAKAHAPSIPVATVANFPTGTAPLPTVLHSIDAALVAGADEIDVVLPYHALIAGDTDTVKTFLTACRAQTKGRVLKVIIESGALNTSQIHTATHLVINCGAEFVKTSTGKIATGATPDAVQTILDTLKSSNQTHTGIKISGGVKTPDIAVAYLRQIESTLGTAWLTPKHLRFGASGLLDQLI